MVLMEFEQNDLLNLKLGAWFLLSREDFHVLKLWAEKEGLESQKTDWNLLGFWCWVCRLLVLEKHLNKFEFFISQSRQRPWLAWLKSNCYWFCFASSLPKCTFNDQLYLFALVFIATALPSHYKPFARFWKKNRYRKMEGKLQNIVSKKMPLNFPITHVIEISLLSAFTISDHLYGWWVWREVKANNEGQMGND